MQRCPDIDSKPTDAPQLSLGDTNLAGAVPTTNGTTSSVPSRPSSQLGMSASSSSLLKVSSTGTKPTGTVKMRLPGTMPGGVKVGDKVYVGTKPGTLRYIGETDFAKGVWGGVQLDEPLGKNDGAVAGKRYFDCKPLHGLFALVHKISRAATSTPSPNSLPLMSTSLRSSRERSRSQDSCSSVRLGVTSLANQGKQDEFRLLSEDKMTKLRALVAEKENEKQELLAFLEEQKRKVKHLKVKLKEEEALKDESNRALKEKEELIKKLLSERHLHGYEVKRAAAHVDEAKSSGPTEEHQLTLERLLKKERARADKLEADLQLIKQKLDDQQMAALEAEDAQASYLVQIEELKHKSNQSEIKLKNFESSDLEDGEKTPEINKELSSISQQIKEVTTPQRKERKKSSTPKPRRLLHRYSKKQIPQPECRVILSSLSPTIVAAINGQRPNAQPGMLDSQE